MTDEIKDETARLTKLIGAHLGIVTKGGVDGTALFAAILYNTCAVGKMCKMDEEEFLCACEEGFKHVGKVERLDD